MNIKRKFKYLFLFLLTIVGTIIGTNTVHAETDNIHAGSYISGPYYYMHTKGSRELWEQVSWIRRSSDNAWVYCVQPFVRITGDTYDVTTSDIASIANISQDNWNTIAKIAYYGYGYNENGYNHSDDRWYPATQMLIWQYADPSVASFFTNTLRGDRNDSILRNEMNEIMSLVNGHYTTPSLSLPSEMVIGNTININDNNGVLNKYNIANVKGANISKSGNTLTITATEVGDLSFSLNKLSDRYKEQIKLYYATSSQNVMRRGDLDPINTNYKIKVVGGKVTVHKVDEETISIVPQGEAKLHGAVYGIYDESGTLIQKVTTKSDGTIQSDYLPKLGTFYLKEITPSEGYELDTHKYYFEVNHADLYPDVQVYEKVIKREFEFIKVYANDKTGVMNPESNIKFEIYNNKNELVLTKTTDAQGVINFSLPYGTYTLKQVNTTSGHEKIQDMTLTVKESGATINKVLANAEITAKLHVVKIDSETGEVINRAGIKFKILNTKTNEYVCQTTSYPKDTICEYQTDENGDFITPFVLGAGTYKLEEVDQLIDGYLWNKESYEFTIDENSKLRKDEKYGIVFDVKFSNTPVKGEVTITKSGEKFHILEEGFEYTDEPLEGIIFGLFQDGVEIARGVTDEKGNLTFSNLKLGKYCVKELKTLDGYILNDDSVCFELKYKDQYTPIITYKTFIENILITTKLEFTKIDFSTDEPLPNTIMEIYTINNELIYSGKTDENGKIIIDRLPIGKYYILEKEAPEGYLINEEKMYFEVTGEDEIIKATMGDKKITGNLEFTKVDISTDEPLPNTLIQIYNEKDELIFEGRTNSEGKITIDRIEYGKYYILEKEAPEGYELNTEKMWFEIKENGEVVKSVMKDKKIVKVPNTDATDYKELIISGITLMILGSGIIIYGKKKKQK